MRKSKLVQQKFSRISGQLGTKNLESFDYGYGLFFDENLPLIVDHVPLKVGYFWSKITPELTQNSNRAQNRTVQKTVQNSLCLGSYGVRMYPENNPRDLLLTRFDLSTKLFDIYT
jgi:hypothetical protein